MQVFHPLLLEKPCNGSPGPFGPVGPKPSCRSRRLKVFLNLFHYLIESSYPTPISEPTKIPLMSKNWILPTQVGVTSML